MSEPVTTQGNPRSLHDPGRPYVLAHEVIKNFALEVCQLLFSSDNLTGLLWDPDHEKTSISIVDKYAFNLDQVALQPAIVAGRGPVAWMRTSGFRQMQDHNFKTGVRQHTDLVRGGVTLSCFSRQGIEAEKIAGFVFEAVQSFRDILRKSTAGGRLVPNHLGFFRVEAASMGEEALIKGGSRPELSVVPVAISAMVQRRWAVVPRDARKLQSITTRISRTP